MRRTVISLALLALAAPLMIDGQQVVVAAGPEPVSSRSSSFVTTEVGLRAAWADPVRRRIDLGADIALRDCRTGDPIRESPYPLLLDGHGHTIRQTCFEKRLLRQDGTGYLDIHDVTLTRGGSDGPGAALTSRGEISLSDCVITQNLAEEPGGGVFSMRRVTARRCHINGNLANDDGGGIYARRGGVQVYDSVLSNNLVDGSGGAIGSTGDILVVRSKIDGNTTDGDGGALYTDEDGDVTVIDSVIDGSDADGPGGAIFALDGDVAVVGSTLVGNRADDRGGAIAGEADVLVVNSTIARNLAVAHTGGGVWARGNLVLVNATVADNYAEGEGGGVLSAGSTTMIGSTLTRNIASVGGDVGTARVLKTFGSIIGPTLTTGVTGDTIPTRRSCRVYEAVSLGYNFSTDTSCVLQHATDIRGPDPQIARLEDDLLGFVMLPLAGSPVQDRIPSGSCRGVLPDPLPAGQLLAAYVDWDRILTRDALDHVRDIGEPCDLGAVQSQATPPVVDLAPRTSRTIPSAPAALPVPSAVLPAEVLVRRPAVDRRPTLAARLDRLATRIARLGHRARRFDVLLDCTRQVGVDQAGDLRHRWGFAYDERDGTGVDRRTALVLSKRARPDLRMLRLSPARRCLSAAPDPNGTGEDARAVPESTSVSALLRRLHRLERRAERVEATTERFDSWESCLSWLPVTEGGDAAQDLGYVTASGRHLPALDVDASEWDDPDYNLLVFTGDNRPFAGTGCETEPGEAVDRSSVPRRDSPRAELRSGIRSLAEDLEDLIEPVQEITQFDECLYTVGVQQRPGYSYRNREGARWRRPALSFDLRGSTLPAMNMMATSGEEPPQIECNEDAGWEDDDGD